MVLMFSCPRGGPQDHDLRNEAVVKERQLSIREYRHSAGPDIIRKPVRPHVDPISRVRGNDPSGALRIAKEQHENAIIADGSASGGFDGLRVDLMPT